jgi:D-arabinitol dehydrogenase (NADP+)
LYKIHNLTDEESTLLEPAACAVHGLDKLNPPVGIEGDYMFPVSPASEANIEFQLAVLLLGAGPTGLILAQLLKLNGASRVVIAANKGIKMNIAKDLEAGDEYIELDRSDTILDQKRKTIAERFTEQAEPRGAVEETQGGQPIRI